MAPKRKTYIQNCTGDGHPSAKKSASHGILARIIFYVLLLSFVGASVYVMFFSMQMQITNISINGTKKLDSSELERKIELSLQGKYLNLVPKNNFLFIAGSGIQSSLKDEYKKIRSVKVEKKFPDSLEITIDEHEALLVWCMNEETCFLLDEEGVAYSEADFNSPELVQNDLLRIVDTSGASIKVGDRIMDSKYEQYLLGIKNAMGSMGLEIEDKYYTPSRMAEEIKTKTTQGFEVYFSTQFELDSAIKTAAVMLKKEVPQQQWRDLAYVDLRTEHKAFYKFKNAAPENAEEEGEDNAKKDSEK